LGCGGELARVVDLPNLRAHVFPRSG
jgi:hypothetical protein